MTSLIMSGSKIQSLQTVVDLLLSKSLEWTSESGVRLKIRDAATNTELSFFHTGCGAVRRRVAPYRTAPCRTAVPRRMRCERTFTVLHHQSHIGLASAAHLASRDHLLVHAVRRGVAPHGALGKCYYVSIDHPPTELTVNTCHSTTHCCADTPRQSANWHN